MFQNIFTNNSYANGNHAVGDCELLICCVDHIVDIIIEALSWDEDVAHQYFSFVTSFHLLGECSVNDVASFPPSEA